MLVLTRKLQQQITVGENITITILRVSGKSVRVGIEAPRDVRVVRAELPARTNKKTSTRAARGTVRRAPLADRLALRTATLPDNERESQPLEATPPLHHHRPAPTSHESTESLRGMAPAASFTAPTSTSERLGALAARTSQWSFT